MTRPFVVLALASSVVVATLLARPARSVSAPPVGRVELHLRNTRWAAVKVEVRLGTADSCDQNTDVWVRTLQKGQVWAVVGDVPVCWRREATPGSAAATTVWATWQRPTLLPGTPTDADL